MASQTHVFEMGMTCDGCANAAKKVLGKLDGISKVEVNVETKKVIVTSTQTWEVLKTTLEKTGKTINYVGIE